MSIKIGFDGKRANANNTGLGNYSRFVIDSLADLYSDNDYNIYIPKRKANREYDAILESYPKVKSLLPKSGFWRGALSSLWRSFSIRGDIRKDGIEIFHGLSNELPFGITKAGCRSVVTIHDLIYARYPKLFKPFDRWVYGIKFKYACIHADRIIAVSECTKRDVVSFFGVEPSKVDVIYQGCAPQFAEKCSAEHLDSVRSKYSLPQRYILNVGTLEDRKNLMLCVKALEHLPTEIHLVACGRRTPYSDRVMEYAAQRGLSERIHLFHKMQYFDLPAIYQGSEVFVYPSYFEGFGIPIIEAQNCGIPVVAATGSCLEEAGGDAALYVDPDDDKALSEAIARFIEDRELRQESIAKGYENVKQFSRERIASDIDRCYRSIIG